MRRSGSKALSEALKNFLERGILLLNCSIPGCRWPDGMKTPFIAVLSLTDWVKFASAKGSLILHHVKYWKGKKLRHLTTNCICTLWKLHIKLLCIQEIVMYYTAKYMYPHK